MNERELVLKSERQAQLLPAPAIDEATPVTAGNSLAASVLRMQRDYGNRYVQRVVASARETERPPQEAVSPVKEEIPIDKSLQDAEDVNRELGIRFIQLTVGRQGVFLEKSEAALLYDRLGLRQLVSNEQSRANVRARRPGETIEYQSDTRTVRTIQDAVKSDRIAAEQRYQRALEELRNAHYAEDAILSFYIGQANGLINLVNGLLDLPVAPINLGLKLAGRTEIHLLGRIPKIPYVGEYAEKYSSSIETGAAIGLALGPNLLAESAELIRLAAPESWARFLNSFSARLLGLTVRGINVGEQISRIFKPILTLGNVSAYLGNVVDVVQIVRQLRYGYKLTAGGKKVPLTADEAGELLQSLLVAAFGLKDIPKLGEKPEPGPRSETSQAPPSEAPPAASTLPERPAEPVLQQEPSRPVEPAGPSEIREPASRSTQEAESAAPPSQPEPAPELTRQAEPQPESAERQPAAEPTPPPSTASLQFQKILNPEGTGFQDPGLQARYEEYVARQERGSLEVANPMTWAGFQTTGGAYDRLKALLGKDFDLASLRPERPVRLIDWKAIVRPETYDFLRLQADFSLLLSRIDTGLFDRLGKLRQRGLSGSQIIEPLFNILKGNIGEILSTDIQNRHLARVRTKFSDAQIYTGIRARQRPGIASTLFTDNIIATKSGDFLYIHAVFEVKSGPTGGAEAQTQVHRWIERNLDTGFQIRVDGEWFTYKPARRAEGTRPPQAFALARGSRVLISPEGTERLGLGSDDQVATNVYREALPQTAAEISYLARLVLEQLVPARSEQTAPSP